MEETFAFRDDEYKRELQKLADEAAERENKRTQLETECRRLQADLDTKNADLAERTRVNQDQAKLIDDMKFNNKSINREMKDLTSKLNFERKRYKEEMSDKDKEVKSLREKDAKKKETSEIDRNFDENMQQLNNRLQRRNDTLLADFNSLQKHCDGVMLKQSESEQEIKRLLKQISYLQESNTSMSVEIREMKQDAEEDKRKRAEEEAARSKKAEDEMQRLLDAVAGEQNI
jgi:chromosome segregation ATPase